MSKATSIQSANRSTRVWLALAACLFAVGAAHGRDWVDFTVAGCKVLATDTPLENFPVAVRISTARIEGFRYSDIASTDDLLFSSTESKDPYPFEVETWNPEGESVIWVRLPSVVTNTKFRMSFNLPPNRPANPDATNVWSAANYRGVWHMNEYDTSATTKTQTDSTGRGNTLTYNDNFGGVSTTYAKIGKGFSRAVTATTAVQIGSLPNLTKTIKMDFVNGCVLSCWTLWGGFTATGQFEFLKLSNNSSSYHWGLNVQSKVFKAKFSTNTGTSISSTQVASGWSHLAIRLKRTGRSTSGGQFEYFLNGKKVLTLNKDSKYLSDNANHNASKTDDYYPTTGAFTVGGTRGRLDEVRFQNGYRSDDWIEAEYDSVNDADFVIAGPVQRGGKMIIMVQ